MQMAMAFSAMGGGSSPLNLESEVEKSFFGGARGELNEHLRKNGRTLREEYELVQQKKSSLSRRMREYVEYLYSKNREDMEKGGDEI